MRERFGVAGGLPTGLPVGWQFTWSSKDNRSQLSPDFEFLPMIQYAAVSGQGAEYRNFPLYNNPSANLSDDNVLLADPICQEKAAYISQAIQQRPASYPDGARFIVFNEMGWDAPLTAQETAHAYATWKACIRAIGNIHNRKYSVGTFALIGPDHAVPRKVMLNDGRVVDNPNRMKSTDGKMLLYCYPQVDKNDPTHYIGDAAAVADTSLPIGYHYMTSFLTELTTRYQETPDFFTYHLYVCNQDWQGNINNRLGYVQVINGVPNPIPKAKIMLSIQRIREIMKQFHLEDRDLVINEFAPLAGPRELTAQERRDFMDMTVNYMATARDQTLGNPTDNYRLVQQWAWFIGKCSPSSPDCYDDFPYLSLGRNELIDAERPPEDQSGTLSHLGEKYRELLDSFVQYDPPSAPIVTTATCLDPNPGDSGSARQVLLSWKGSTYATKYIITLKSFSHQDLTWTVESTSVCSSSFDCEYVVPIEGGVTYPDWNIRSVREYSGNSFTSPTSSSQNSIFCPSISQTDKPLPPQSPIGSISTIQPGDFNTDGIRDEEDYTIFIAHGLNTNDCQYNLVGICPASDGAAITIADFNELIGYIRGPSIVPRDN